MHHGRPTSQWSDIELSVVRTLSVQVKYLTVEQVARGWFVDCDEPKHDATCLLESLANSDLLIEETIEVYDAPHPFRPLLEWKPGDPPPTFDRLNQLAETLGNRWSERLRPVTVFQTSRKAANSFGTTTTDSKDRSSDWSHDLFISEVLLRYRKARKSEVDDWIGEAFLPKLGFMIKGMKDPDAFLVVDGRIERVIEIGGKYTAEHLRSLHEHCDGGAYKRIQEFASSKRGTQALRLYDKRRIPYEIW